METKGQLKIIVLKLLYNGDLNGYGLINEIKEKTGFWKPSPGSIYPLMKDLHEKGLVIVKKYKNQKIYSITAKGKELFDKLRDGREEVIDTIKQKAKLFELIGNKKDIKPIISFIDLFKEDDIFLKNNISFLIELKLNILNALQDKKDPEKISKIIKEASKKIKKL